MFVPFLGSPKRPSTTPLPTTPRRGTYGIGHRPAFGPVEGSRSRFRRLIGLSVAYPGALRAGARLGGGSRPFGTSTTSASARTSESRRLRSPTAVPPTVHKRLGSAVRRRRDPRNLAAASIPSASSTLRAVVNRIERAVTPGRPDRPASASTCPRRTSTECAPRDTSPPAVTHNNSPLPRTRPSLCRRPHLASAPRRPPPRYHRRMRTTPADTAATRPGPHREYPHQPASASVKGRSDRAGSRDALSYHHSRVDRRAHSGRLPERRQRSPLPGVGGGLSSAAMPTRTVPARRPAPLQHQSGSHIRPYGSAACVQVAKQTDCRRHSLRRGALVRKPSPHGLHHQRTRHRQPRFASHRQAPPSLAEPISAGSRCLLIC